MSELDLREHMEEVFEKVRGRDRKAKREKYIKKDRERKGGKTLNIELNLMRERERERERKEWVGK